MYTAPQMPQDIEPLEPEPFPSLWSLTHSTIDTWKSGWAIFSLINLIVVILGGIAWLIIVSVMPWLQEVIAKGNNIDPNIIAAHYPTTSILISDLSTVCLVLLLFIISVIISQVMTIHAMNPELRHKGFLYLLKTSLQMTPRYLWTVSIISLIVMGGMALLLVPGILLLPLAAVTVFVAALENKKGIQAVAQGAFYVKGYVIEALWRSLVILIAIQAISLILPLLATLIVYPFTLLNFSAHTIKILGFTAGTLYTFVSFVLSLVLPSILMIFYYHMYNHMKHYPTDVKPLNTHVLRVLAIIGLILVVSIMLLETFGF